MFSLENLASWFLLFIMYSFAGWLMEVIISLASRRKFIDRGFLVGPICPIYGTGAVFVSLMLSGTENPFVIFCVSMVGATTLEYITSWIMEQLFRVRWWDYSERPFNINGRVCLQAAVAFGIFGILAIKLVNPCLFQLIGLMPHWLLYAVAGGLLVLLISDIALSLWLVVGVRVTVGTVQRDATDEISTRVREILMDKNKLNRRLVKAFPNQAPTKKPIRTSTKKKAKKTQSQGK